jgi:hypothetical protein
MAVWLHAASSSASIQIILLPPHPRKQPPVSLSLRRPQRSSHLLPSAPPSSFPHHLLLAPHCLMSSFPHELLQSAALPNLFSLHPEWGQGVRALRGLLEGPLKDSLKEPLKDSLKEPLTLTPSAYTPSPFIPFPYLYSLRLLLVSPCRPCRPEVSARVGGRS